VSAFKLVLSSFVDEENFKNFEKFKPVTKRRKLRHPT